MKTITLNNATIDIDELTTEQRNQLLDALTPVAAKRELWTPKENDQVYLIQSDGVISDGIHNSYYWQDELDAGNIFPTREPAEAAKRHREAQSVIDRYCYAKGIDTRWKEGVEQFCAWLDKDKLRAFAGVYTCDGSPFFVESKETAEQIIADCGDEIRTVLLRGWV